jgi:hypothetical protein
MKGDTMAEITDGDYIDIDEFIENCLDGGFIDYDGFGILIKQTERGCMLLDEIRPSDIGEKYSVDGLKILYDGVWWINR